MIHRVTSLPDIPGEYPRHCRVKLVGVQAIELSQTVVTLLLSEVTLNPEEKHPGIRQGLSPGDQQQLMGTREVLSMKQGYCAPGQGC